MKLVIIDDDGEEEVKEVLNTRFSIIATDENIINCGFIDEENLLEAISNIIARSYNTLTKLNKNISKNKYLAELIYTANSIIQGFDEVDASLIKINFKDKPVFIDPREYSIQSLENYIENNISI